MHDRVLGTIVEELYAANATPGRKNGHGNVLRSFVPICTFGTKLPEFVSENCSYSVEFSYNKGKYSD